jgi:imidazoleglycerol phosphate dehydratase HisB
VRKAEVNRETRETKIRVKVNIDGIGESAISTGVAFFDHLLRTLAVHSRIDLTIQAEGDLRHHIIEDVGLCLGQALREALGERQGIRRFGYAIVPMDDAMSIAAVDLASRPYAKIELGVNSNYVEDINKQELLHFLETLGTSLSSTVHLHVQCGTNDHHKIEAAFKALALSLRQATSLSDDVKLVPSAKGSL